MKSHFVLVAILFLAGCSFSGGRPGVKIYVDGSQYVRGADMGIEVRNESFRTVTLHPNLCGVGFEATDGSGVVYPDQVCTAIAASLAPGESLQTTRVVPDTLAIGRYRLIYDFSSGITGRSRAFNVN